MKVVLRLVKSFSGPPDPGSRYDGPGPSYLDEGSGGPESDFTNRNLTFMTFNLMHLAAMLRAAGGVPAYGNQRTAWDQASKADEDNPEHR